MLEVRLGGMVLGGLVFGVGMLRSHRYTSDGYSTGTSSLCFVGAVICIGFIIASLT